jgi:outer membrane protein assembly factor BamA
MRTLTGKKITALFSGTALALTLAVALSRADDQAARPAVASPPAPAPAQDAEPAAPAAPVKKSFSAFPIAMYDTDIGFGFGGKGRFINYLKRKESFDLILFGSTKGERWAVFTFSIPDPEIRLGTRYGLAFDFRAEYDKYISYSFYGLGPDSVKTDETVATYLKEELGLTFGHGFSPVLVAEAAYILRRYKTYNVEPDQPFTDVLEAEGTKFSPYLSLALRYDTSNSQIHPTRGVRLAFQNDFAAGALGNSAGKFYRMTLDLRFYNRFLFKGAVLAVRGLVQDVTGSKIPLWDMSSLGGGSTMNALRGFALNRFMDKGKFLACAEFRFPIWKRFGGNLFGEGGLVWPNWSGIDLGKAVFDAGWGLRYYLKNFVVRFDMGFSGEGTGIYFNFGHLF